MPPPETITSGTLTVEITESPEHITVRWLGKSIEDSLEKFILPIVEQLLAKGPVDKRIILDFTELSYINSSTIAPVIRFLEQMNNDSRSVSVQYQIKGT